VEGTTDMTASERWHELLTTRYICEVCLTRYYQSHWKCPACRQIGCVRPLVSMLLTVARNDQELREMMARGQTVTPDEVN
jgi:hypothetical protein